jgi:gliding motility associated protien GldN
MKNFVLASLLFLLLGANTSFAQGVYDDFIYSRNSVVERKVVEWPYLRHADVMFSKRVWRVIDTREKQNQPMKWDKNPLNLILYNAVTSNQLTPYIDDSLKSFLTTEQFVQYQSRPVINKRLIDPEGADDDPSNIEYDTIYESLRASDIKKYRIMEDWIFDKKESRMYIRIIAIAPIVTYLNSAGEEREAAWAWFKYHKDPSDSDVADVRSILVNMEVFNRQNDAARLSYDDWFEQRLFSSYIVKENNAYDLEINEFSEFAEDGEAALLESERIKQELFEKEHDLWEY